MVTVIQSTPVRTVTAKGRKSASETARFHVGDHVFDAGGPYESGTVIAVSAPNSYGYRMLTVRSDAGPQFGILEAWPSATREEAEARYVERYGSPPPSDAERKDALADLFRRHPAIRRKAAQA